MKSQKKNSSKRDKGTDWEEEEVWKKYISLVIITIDFVCLFVVFFLVCAYFFFLSFVRFIIEIECARRRLYHFECQNETDPSDQQISIYENDKTLYRPEYKSYTFI